MPYSSPEVLQLEAIRDWMATLSVWTSATGGDNHVFWPIKAADSMPACVLSLQGGRTVNLTGAAGGSNFQPSGSIGMLIYAADTGGADEQKGYSDFADFFYGLISEMADKAHQSPVVFNEFVTPPVPIMRSSWFNVEDDDEGLADWWQGLLTISWGVEA